MYCEFMPVLIATGKFYEIENRAITTKAYSVVSIFFHTSPLPCPLFFPPTPCSPSFPQLLHWLCHVTAARVG